MAATCWAIWSSVTRPSTSPRVKAKPELVVASAVNPSASRTRADPTSHGFGITNGSPACIARKADPFSCCLSTADMDPPPSALRLPQGLGESVDIGFVVVRVQGDPESIPSTPADDPMLGCEACGRHVRAVSGVPQGNDVGRSSRIIERPERAPAESFDPIDESRRQVGGMSRDAIEAGRRQDRHRRLESDHGRVRHRRQFEASCVVGESERSSVERERVVGSLPADDLRETIAEVRSGREQRHAAVAR